MTEIKQNIITWLCDPNVSYLEGIKKQIDEEFTKMFPAIRSAMKSFSTGANGMSTRAMHLEGKFFNRLCRQVNKFFHRAVTKFDSIIVQDGFQRRTLNRAFVQFKTMFGYSPFLKIKTAQGNYLKVATLQAPSSLTNENDKNCVLLEKVSIEKEGREGGGSFNTNFFDETNETNETKNQKSLHFKKGQEEEQQDTSLVKFEINETKNETNETKIYTSTEGSGEPLSPRVKVISLDKIREINNNGSRAWKYRGTGKQEMKASCKKMTKEEFLAKVNEKFISGEWK